MTDYCVSNICTANIFMTHVFVHELNFKFHDSGLILNLYVFIVQRNEINEYIDIPFILSLMILNILLARFNFVNRSVVQDAFGTGKHAKNFLWICAKQFCNI